MTKYRKPAIKSTTRTKATASEQEKAQKTGSGYNPETWTEQFFREKREAEERIRNVEFSEGEKNETSISAKADDARIQKGIPAQKGIPGHDESEVE